MSQRPLIEKFGSRRRCCCVVVVWRMTHLVIVSFFSEIILPL